jgi:YD repeat-containing protein
LNRVTQALYPTTPNIVERFSYDGEGNLLTHVDGHGVTRQMSYDNLGRVKDNFTIGAGGNIPGVTVSHIEQAGSDTVTDPDGVQLVLPFASKDIETDPLGHQTTKRYDGLHRILSITNADSRSKRYEYDGVNLTRESDWKGQFTSFRYDRVNRLTEMIDRVGQLTTISYKDANGLTKRITDRRTNQRVEVYDALGLVFNCLAFAEFRMF